MATLREWNRYRGLLKIGGPMVRNASHIYPKAAAAITYGSVAWPSYCVRLFFFEPEA